MVPIRIPSILDRPQFDGTLLTYPAVMAPPVSRGRVEYLELMRLLYLRDSLTRISRPKRAV